MNTVKKLANKAKRIVQKAGAPNLVAIVGPTASGKTALSIALAKQLRGEIINADSRQFFVGMDIGTDKAKIVDGTVDGIPHHLFDIAPPTELLNVAEYRQQAYNIIDAVHERGALPFLVGGSGFYTKSVIEGTVFPDTAPDVELRAKLEKRARRDGTDALYERLKSLDPDTAGTIDKNNPRRLIRAIEIATQLGSRPRVVNKPRYDVLVLGIAPAENYEEKIAARVDYMIAAGLEQEVRSLVDEYGWTPVLENTMGYIEWREYLARESDTDGAIGIDRLKATLVVNHRRLVKKQMTWLRKQKNITWVKDRRDAIELIQRFL